MPVFALVAMSAYPLSLVLIILSVIRRNSAYRRLALISVVVGLAYHAVALQQRIFDFNTGQNLSLVNIGSVASLIIGTAMTIAASRNRGWFVLPIVYSFSLINLAFVTFISGEFITHLAESEGLLVHIGMALFFYATLMIADLYALQLAWLDYQLKSKRLTFTADMPPLMSIERKLFHTTQIGFVLLTLTLFTGMPYLDSLFNSKNIDKTVLSILAWFVYIVLLWDHHYEGWRGRRVGVVWFSITGTVLLTFAYFGSRLIR